MYVESKTERIFCIACLEKKLAFETEICYYFEYFFSKIGLFDRVKELFKSEQTRYGVSPGYVEPKTERVFCYSLYRKKGSLSIGNIDLFAYCSLILFSKI